MVTEQMERKQSWTAALGTVHNFNTKSLVLALQNTTTRTATHGLHYSVCLYIYVCVCVYVHVCVHVYICLHIYIYIQ